MLQQVLTHDGRAPIVGADGWRAFKVLLWGDVRSPCGLYRAFDAAGALLYIGVTHCPFKRFDRKDGHARTADWYHRSRTVTVEIFEDRFAAFAAEERAIKAEQPPCNAIHRRREWRASSEHLNPAGRSAREPANDSQLATRR
jgi:hypothetical protein